MSDPHEREEWENRDDLGDALVGAGRVLLVLTIVGLIFAALLLAVTGCTSAAPREPRVNPRVLLTDPESAWLLDLLNLRDDQPVPPHPAFMLHWSWRF